MRAVGALRHEGLESDAVVAPHVCDYMVIPERGGVLAQCTPRGQPWARALALPHGRDGLRVWLIAVGLLRALEGFTLTISMEEGHDHGNTANEHRWYVGY